MTVKGVFAAAVVLLAICLFVRGQSSAAPGPRPVVHLTTKAHGSAAPHTPAHRR
jgi:hypothetical protein